MVLARKTDAMSFEIVGNHMKGTPFARPGSAKRQVQVTQSSTLACEYAAPELFRTNRHEAVTQTNPFALQ